MALIGGIEIEMWAGIARLQKDMDDAKRVVGNAMGAIKTAVGAALGALSINAFAGWIKGAIDAADATYQLSQKTGIAAKDIAGIQLAFQQAGLGSEAMGTSIARMSRQMAEGNAAFRTLGVETRNADGSLRDTMAVLYDTADAFAGIKDGAGKTALAMEIFGKSGAELIPLLNGGADGLREMASMAEKLGLVISADTAEAADRFNDTMELVGQGSQGVARTLAAQMLPVLQDLAGGFLTSMTEGDRLKNVAEVLGVAMKGLYTVIAGGVQVFATFGRSIGALGAALAAFVSGDFAAARNIGKEWMTEIKTDWTRTVENIGSVWDGSAGKTVEATAKVTRAVRDVTLRTKEQEEAARKAAAAAAKQAEEMRKLAEAGANYVAALEDQNDAMERAIDTGRDLTIAEKELLKLEKDLAESKIILTDAELKQALAEIERKQALHDLQQQLTSTTAENEKFRESVRKQADDLRAQADAQLASNEAIGLSGRALLEHQDAVMADRQALLLRKAAMMDEVDATVAQAYRDQAAALGDLRTARVAAFDKAEAAAVGQAWMDEWSRIGQGLLGSLRGGIDGVKDYLKRAFEHYVIEIPLSIVGNALGNSVGGWVANLLGLATPAGGGSGGGGGAGGVGSLLSGASTLNSAYNYASGAYQWAGNALGFGAGAGLYAGGSSAAASIGGTYAGAALAEGTGAIAAGSAASGAAGASGTFLGMGPYGWIAAAVIAVVAALGLDQSGTHHSGSVVSATSAGAYTDPSTDPGGVLNHLNTGIDTFLKGTSAQALGTINLLAEMFGAAGNFSTRGLFAADGNDASIGAFSVSRDGQLLSEIPRDPGSDVNRYSANPEEALQQYSRDIGITVRDAMYAIDLPQWARDALAALGEAPTLDQLDAIVTRIREVTDAMTAEFEPLGGVFERIAGLSTSAKLQLADFAGGIDAFIAKTRQYVDLYYTEEEKLALKARDILARAGAAGFDASGANELLDLRRAMEATDVGTEEGRRIVAALLDLAGDFAPVGKYLEEQGLTLAELANSSPQVAALEELQTPTEVTAEAAVTTADATTELVDETTAQTPILETIAENTGAQADANAAGMTQIVALLTELLAEFRAARSDADLAAAAPT